MEGEILYIDGSTSEINNAEKQQLCLNFHIKNVQPTNYQLKLSIQDSPEQQIKDIGYTAPQGPKKNQEIFINVSFIIDYFFNKKQILFIDIARQGLENISANVPVGQILGSTKSQFDLPFNGTSEILNITATSMNSTGEFFQLDVEAQNAFGNFFYVIYKRKNYSENKKEYFGVYKSPLQAKSNSFIIPGKYLDYGNHDQPIMFELYLDGKVNGKKEITVNQLLQNEKYLIGDFSFLIKIKKIEKQEKSFIGLVNDNLQISLSIAIDFTGSNGDFIESFSYHYLSEKPTQYEQAIKACGEILSYYDSEKIYPCYGFGAKVKGKMNHCFPLDLDRNTPNIKGIDNILKTYRETIPQLLFGAPTYFGLFLTAMFNNIREELKTKFRYHIILILTDGAITDMENTINIIVDGSDLPVSIIIVGIGTKNFDNMNILDADQEKLKNKKTGKEAIRDIVQFVKFNDYKNDANVLSQKVLEEIPTQIETYFKLNKK